MNFDDWCWVLVVIILGFLVAMAAVGCVSDNPCSMAGMSAAEIEQGIARGCGR